MSKFFKISLATVAAAFLSVTAFAQSTIEEVIVTAQRTEQSLQDVPIAVSAFTEDMLEERQMEFASDIQLQVPGLGYTADTFNGGGFSIRGVANFATAASADAGVEVHINGLPIGATSTNEAGFLDMARIEVLRGPQGTLFGRNSTGGVINMITARPDLDAFEGRFRVQAGSDDYKNIEIMLNMPISDELGIRLAYTNFEKDGVTKNLYSQASNNFDDRGSYQWRASLQWEPRDSSTLTLIHNAFDEESNRQQISGVFCETGSNLVQGCVMGGQRVFQPVHPMSNGSTLPGLLGGTLGFYVPNTVTNGTAGGAATYAPTGLPKDNGTVPTQFFEQNVWAAPRHDAQESNTQILFEEAFDQGTLSVAYNNKRRQFYRDTSSLSSEGSGVRWSAAVQALPFYSTAQGNEGLPLGYSNNRIAPQCAISEFKAGIFCPNGQGVRGNHVMPASGDASTQDQKGTTYEIRYSSDLDGMFNFLVGAIDISNDTYSFYDVYASGITLNALSLPSAISNSTRTTYRGLLTCGQLGAVQCASVLSLDPTTAAITAGTGQAVAAGLAPAVAAYSALGITTNTYALAHDMVSRIDGLYTEFFHNTTESYKLDSTALFAEFYFDVAENHKLTAGLRYNEDTKSVSVNSTFYKVPLLSAWSANMVDANGLNGTCGINAATGLPNSYNMATGAETAACFTSNGITAPDGSQANTKGQTVGQVPTATGVGNTNGSQIFGVLPANNADYVANGISPIKDFSETTGRIVWDYQINDDTLFYASYSIGFKGGGFNPPFNAAAFPNTPFAFESTEVDALEFGVKASVPEEGITANASVYYYDFKNYHIGVIRNETAINTGMPLETYGAELEFYLAPPSVPGLAFNMMFTYQDSEIGQFSLINPHDLGGHYNQVASTGAMDGYTDWHVAKNQTANSFLVNKNALGYMYGKILDVQLSQAGAAAAAAAGGGDAAAQATAGNNAIAALRGSNEIAFGLTCTAAADCGTTNSVANTALTAGDLVNIVPFEMSSHAEGYGNLGGVCHFMTAVGGPNTCLPAAGGGTASSIQVYSPQANATGSAGPTGTLLPSIIVRGTGAGLQTAGICKLFDAMTDHAPNVVGGANELSIASDELCLGTATAKGKFLSSGIAQNVSGNQMPFADMSLSMGVAYTFQTDNLEVTPRVDYYYQSDRYSSIFNIEAAKLPAWDEINFSLSMVPTNGDWNIRIWAQNLTDDRNITATGVGNSSVGHTQSVFVREPRSFGMSFGLDF